MTSTVTKALNELSTALVNRDIRNIFLYSILGSTTYIILTSFILNSQFEKHIFEAKIGPIYPYFLVLSLILIIFAAVLFFRSYALEHSSLNILTIAVLLSGISYLFGFFNFDLSGNDFRQTRLFQLQVFTQTVSIFLFYIHYELNSYKKPRVKFLVPYIILLWPYSFLNIYYFISRNYDSGGALGNFQDVTQYLLQFGVVLIFAWLLYNSIGITKLFLEKGEDVRKAALIQLAGMVILVIGVIFQIVEFAELFNVWHTPLNIVAILFLGIPYVKNSNVMILSPVNVLVIGVIDQSGRTMYFKAIDKDFANDKAIETTSDLFGGLTLALSSLGKEVAKSQTNVDSLQFSDRSIIVEYLEPYYLVVIANRSTYYLEKEMEEYLSDLSEEFPEVPKDGRVIPEAVFDRLNKKFFPIILQI